MQTHLNSSLDYAVVNACNQLQSKLYELRVTVLGYDQLSQAEYESKRAEVSTVLIELAEQIEQRLGFTTQHSA